MRRAIIVCLTSLLFLLAGCGGGNSGSDNAGPGPSGSNKVGGSAAGVESRAVELTLTAAGVEETLILAIDGNFTFDAELDPGTDYTVAISFHSPDLLCSLSGGTGVVSGSSSRALAVTCGVVNLYPIGGMASGVNLGSVGLLLETTTGTATAEVTTDGGFAFSGTYQAGTGYSVEIVSVPVGLDCALEAASGTVSEFSTEAVQLNCFTIPQYTVGGTLTGLTHDSVSLTLASGGQSEELLLEADGSFVFANSYYSGYSYLVSLIDSPIGLLCSMTGGSGVVGPDAPTAIAIDCVFDENQPVSITGTVTVAANTDVDSDINDPFSEYQDNSSFESAQTLNNIVTLQGFAAAEPTGFDGDVFAAVADESDIYRTSFQAGQVISLQVVNYDGFNNDSQFSGDLDLGLFDLDFNLVAASTSVDEFERITVGATGDYYVAVIAYSGASRYLLQLRADGLGSTNIGRNNSRHAHSGSVDFVTDEAIVQLKPAAAHGKGLLAAAKVSHADAGRPLLAHFNAAPLAAYKTAQPAPALLASLAGVQPDSLAKWQTLMRIKALNQQDSVALAEPNYRLRASRIPNDSYYPLQWHYSNMSMPQMWDKTVGSTDVIVAVIDTGVFLAHPDLQANLVAGYDFISDSGNANDGDGIDSSADDPGDGLFPGASSWHGTHVAGTIAAVGNNGLGVTGVSWRSKVMPLRVLGTEGGTSYDLQQAVRYAAGLANDSGSLPASPADVINLSLGGPGSLVSDQELFTAVVAEGVVVVAAAGNENSPLPSYPAAYDGVISVAAVGLNDERAPYSNFGETIDIAAPGGDMTADLNRDGEPDGVLSTYVNDSSGTRLPAYTFLQGTSMASPHVAGMIAMMKSIYPDLTPAQVQGLLQTGAITNDVGEEGFDEIYGYGVANALSAAQAAIDLAAGSVPAFVTATPARVLLEEETESIVTLSNLGGAFPRIISYVSTEAWLTVTRLAVDDAGLGDYTFAVDRTGLSDGYYSAKVSFSLATGGTVQVYVSMVVGDVEAIGQSGQLYVVLYDNNANAVVDEVWLEAVGDGTFSFDFTETPGGDYLIFAGSDIDNDYLICQIGEVCGVYPSFIGTEVIQLRGEDVTGISITAAVLGGLSDSELNAAAENRAEPKSARGLSRVPKALP